MPKKPPSTRPKIKYKKVGRKPAPPKKTKEETAAKRLANLEARYKLSPQKVVNLLHREHGLINRVCRALKMHRPTLVRYIERYPQCIEALVTARETMGDIAEKKLYELIEAGDVRCILYYLSTVHRARGYGLKNSDSFDNAALGNTGPVTIETVNIIGIPSGTFLPKEIASKDSMVIEHEK